MRKMKESSIEWIGDIPEGWGIRKIKQFYNIVLGKMLSPEKKENDATYEKYLCAQNITEQGLKLDVVKKMWFSEREKSHYLIRKGELLVVEGGNIGLCCVYNDEISPCYIQNALHKVSSKGVYSIKFLYYWMKFVEKSSYLQQLVHNATINHYTKDKFGNTPIVFVEHEEQQRIADYLDAKCARIDEAAELVRQSMEKLRAYKLSLITEAVTKGLDPDVPMKDSGIPWIGKIPISWNCLPLKRVVASVKTGSTPKGAEEKYYAENGLKWFTPADFTAFPYIDSSAKKLSELGINEVKIFPQDSVLLIGIGATMGKVALACSQCAANQQINSIQCKKELLPLFLTFYLSTITDYLFKCGKFTTLPILNQEETKNIYIPIPPLSEQQRIAGYLDAKCARIDALLEEKERLLDRLAEYKKSLIFECVTGKREVSA